MKSLEVRIPHALGRDEVRRRLDAAIVRAREEYADKVGRIDASWQADGRLDLQLVVVGMDIDGEIELLESELVVRVDVPGMAGLFAGRITDGIRERVGGLLAVQPA